MNSNSDMRKTMDELMEMHQQEEPEIVPEKVVVEIPEEVIIEMQEIQLATLKLVRQIATEMPRLTRETELQNLTRVLSENMELKRKNALLEERKSLAETEEKIKQAGKTSERNIEQTERRISHNIEELTESINNLCGKAVLIVSGAVLAAVLVSVCLLWLR